MNYEEFLKKLRDTRIAKNVSYKEIGGAIGVTPQTIYAMEKGKTSLRMKDYFVICELLNIPPRELFDTTLPKGEYRSIAERLSNLSKRDSLIIRDLIMLMEISEEDL